MSSPILVQQIERLRGQLLLSGKVKDHRQNATKGQIRESFVKKILEGGLPATMRTSTGEIVDAYGHHSGQLDVIIESNFAPSIPEVGDEDVKLHTAEGVIAVIEVKSDLAAQWQEVERTATALQDIKRSLGSSETRGARNIERIPLYAVGYRGWKKLATARSRVDDETLAGLLILSSNLHVSRHMTVQGDGSLLGFLWSLYYEQSTIVNLRTNIIPYFE